MQLSSFLPSDPNFAALPGSAAAPECAGILAGAGAAEPAADFAPAGFDAILAAIAPTAIAPAAEAATPASLPDVETAPASTSANRETLVTPGELIPTPWRALLDSRGNATSAVGERAASAANAEISSATGGAAQPPASPSAEACGNAGEVADVSDSAPASAGVAQNSNANRVPAQPSTLPSTAADGETTGGKSPTDSAPPLAASAESEPSSTVENAAGGASARPVPVTGDSSTSSRPTAGRETSPASPAGRRRASAARVPARAAIAAEADEATLPATPSGPMRIKRTPTGRAETGGESAASAADAETPSRRAETISPVAASEFVFASMVAPTVPETESDEQELSALTDEEPEAGRENAFAPTAEDEEPVAASDEPAGESPVESRAAPGTTLFPERLEDAPAPRAGVNSIADSKNVDADERAAAPTPLVRTAEAPPVNVLPAPLPSTPIFAGVTSPREVADIDGVSDGGLPPAVNDSTFSFPAARSEVGSLFEATSGPLTTAPLNFPALPLRGAGVSPASPTIPEAAAQPMPEASTGLVAESHRPFSAALISPPATARFMASASANFPAATSEPQRLEAVPSDSGRSSATPDAQAGLAPQTAAPGLPNTAAPIAPPARISQAANSAARIAPELKAPAGQISRSVKSFLSVDKTTVTERAKSLGIDVAKSEAAMPSAPILEFPRDAAPLRDVAPEFVPEAATPDLTPSIAAVSSPATHAGEMRETSSPSEMFAVSSAHRAVEVVLTAVDHLASRERHSVDLQFSVGGEDLAVRVELRADTVHATFRTDSPELRNALAHEWQGMTGDNDRSAARVTPVFTSGESSNFAGGDAAAQQRDSRARQMQEDMPARNGAGRSRRSEVGAVSGAAVTLSTGSSARAMPRTSRHLHTLA